MITVGWKYATGIGSKGTYVSMPKVSRFWMYFPVPLAGVAMVVFEIEALYNHVKKDLCKGGSKIMDANTFAILVLLGSFFLMIFLRFPIAYAVALSSVFCLVAQGHNLTTICQQMVKGISSFSLMAVPFFITMGCLMGSGGISEKLIALANACVGWMRGGMAMVNIVASYFFGGISGSASADTASLGSILIPMMVDQGYDGDFSTAVTITSSCEGLLVPPSHNMVIYATTAGGISVGSLFLAGYIPGALLAASLMVGSYIISVKRNYPKGDKFSMKVLLKQFSVSFWLWQPF